MTSLTEILVDLPLLASIILKITIVLGVSWFLHFIFAKRNPRWRILLWRCAITSLLLIPALVPLAYLQISIIPPPEHVVIAPSEPTLAYPIIETSGFSEAEPIQISQPVASDISQSSFSLTAWLRANIWIIVSMGWGSVATILILRLLVGFLRVRKRIISSEPGPEHLQQLLDRVTEDLGSAKKVMLRYSPDVSTPLLTGLLRPIIILPERMIEGKYESKWAAIFAHEVAHLKSRDLIWTLMIRWFGIILWFHPLVWKLRGTHSAACEEVCDAVAAEYIGNTEFYSSTLASLALEILGKVQVVGGIPMVRSSEIVTRLRILKQRFYPNNLARQWLVLSVLVSSLALAVIGGLSLVYAESSETTSNLEEGLVLYYSFDTNKERTVTDLSGKDNHGKIRSGTYTSNGRVGRAISFNGAGDYIDTGDDSSIQTEVFTLSAWIKTSDIKDVWQSIISYETQSHAVSVLPNGHISYGWQFVGRGGEGISDVRSGKWVFVAVTKDSDNKACIYVNGKLENSFICKNKSKFIYTAKIGGDVTSNEYFKGSIDEVRIYNRVLPAFEVKELYDATAVATSSKPSKPLQNVAENIRIEPPDTVSIHGVVRDQTGKPAAGVLVLPLPHGGHPVMTDIDGEFELAGHSEDHRVEVLLVRDSNNNLAAGKTFDYLDYCITKACEITLTPAATLTGRIIDPQGNPISGANVIPLLLYQRWGAYFGYTTWPLTDTNGVYEIKTLPVGHKYEIYVGRVEGYGRNEVTIGVVDQPGRKELDDIVLEPANLSVSGVVLDDNLKPMPGVSVQASGEIQPYREVKTDSAGKFKIDGLCKGRLFLYARTSDNLWETTGDEANGGDSNIEIYMTKDTRPKVCMTPPENPPVSLVGKRMPSLETLGIHLPQKDIKDKQILVCFWKLMHDESRDYIRQLAARSEELAKKNIVIVAAQIWPRNEKQFRRWLEKNNVKFPVSILPDPWKQKPEQRPVYRWGMPNRVPWLILTDNQHVVRAESFSIDDLDAKIHLSEKP